MLEATLPLTFEIDTDPSI